MNIRKRNQAFFSSSPQPFIGIISNPSIYFEQLSPLRQRVLNLFLQYSNHWTDIYLTQSTVARHAGCTREEVCRILKEFEEVGLLASDYRHMTSKLYKISSWFYLPEIRRKLAKIFPALNWLPFVLLTQLINNSYFDISETVKLSTFERDIICAVGKKSRAIFVKQFSDEILYARSIGERVMQGDYSFSKAILDISEMQLTTWGQVELSLFPDAAINDTRRRMRATRNIRDPFRWFCKMCHEYCQREDRSKDYTRYHTLKAYYKTPEKPTFVVAEPAQVYKKQPVRAASKPYYNTEAQQLESGTPKVPVFVEEPPRDPSYILAELDKFAALRQDKERNAQWDKLFGPGNAVAYINRCMANLEQEYVRSLQHYKLLSVTDSTFDATPSVSPIRGDSNPGKEPNFFVAESEQTGIVGNSDTYKEIDYYG